MGILSTKGLSGHFLLISLLAACLAGCERLDPQEGLYGQIQESIHSGFGALMVKTYCDNVESCQITSHFNCQRFVLKATGLNSSFGLSRESYLTFKDIILAEAKGEIEADVDAAINCGTDLNLRTCAEYRATMNGETVRSEALADFVPVRCSSLFSEL